MQRDPRAVHIFTDGSCYANPGGIGGCAAIVIFPDQLNRGEEQILDFGCAETTNNRMELLACIRALRWIRENRGWPGVARVQIITDSKYVADTLPHARNWKGGKNRFGQPMENADLWRELLSAYSKVGITVHIQWSAGKKTPELKRIDAAAKRAAKRGGPDVDRGYRPGTIARSMVKAAATPFPAQNQSAVIRPYRKNLAKELERIRFDLFSELKGEYTASHYAFAAPSLAAQLHRQHGYRVQFNDQPRFPQIIAIIEEISLPTRQSP